MSNTILAADTALRLSRYLGTTPQLWLNLQKTFDLRVAQIETGKHIEDLVQLRGTAEMPGSSAGSAIPYQER